jgi:hypothetical protein
MPKNGGNGKKSSQNGEKTPKIPNFVKISVNNITFL